MLFYINTTKRKIMKLWLHTKCLENCLTCSTQKKIAMFYNLLSFTLYVQFVEYVVWLINLYIIFLWFLKFKLLCWLSYNHFGCKCFFISTKLKENYEKLLWVTCSIKCRVMFLLWFHWKWETVMLDIKWLIGILLCWFILSLC